MHELVTPQQSGMGVLIASGALLVVGALWGFRKLGARGVLIGLAGPLLLGLWQGHKWLTRYDAQSGYFGLDKVNVLGLEIVIFVALGVTLGYCWNKFISRRDAEDAEV